MPEDDWVWLKLARLRLAEAHFGALGAALRPNRAWAERCARDAEQRLQRAWEEGTLPLRGVPTGPGSHESVEIPPSEAGNHWLDCPGSLIFRGRGPGRPRLMDYHSVQMRKADVERLAREAGGDTAGTETQVQASPPDESAVAPDAHEANAKPQEEEAASDAQEADTKPRAVASWLHRLFPNGRPPGRSNKDLGDSVRRKAGEKLGGFSPRTLDRAIQLAWPRQTSPKRAKAR
jgi:hypothetical protein